MRDSSFWRTSQASLLQPPPLWTRPKANSKSARQPASWGNWPTSGGMRNGSLYPRPPWEPAIAANDGSALHGEAAWATPDCWASPRASDAEKGGPNCRGGRGDPILPGQACQWPTPNTPSGGRTLPPEVCAAKGATPNGKRQVPLEMVAAYWPTPASRDHKGENSEAHVTTNSTGRMHMDQLPNFVAYSPQARTIPDGPISSLPNPGALPHSLAQPSEKLPRLLRRRLNPFFVEFLMGWPPGWTLPEPTACGHVETALWRHRLRRQLSSLCGGQAYREAA